MNCGTLYIVATPIGNLDDLSPRARATLDSVALIAAEDTRHSLPLLRHFGITTRLVALHEHNEAREAPRLIERLRSGDDIALISDAGTPLISDPGYLLLREAHQNGIRVVPVPGPSAAIAALSVSGLPTDRFAFEGFPPSRPGGRRKALEAVRQETRTVVFYEAPHRVLETLRDMAAIFGSEREAVFCRELTKAFETVRKDTLAGLIGWVEADPNQQRGEIVLVVGGAEQTGDETLREGRQIVALLLDDLPVRKASALASRITGASKNELYRFAVELMEAKKHKDT